MKLKKLIVSLAVSFSLLTLTSVSFAEEVSDAKLNSMINKYKTQNYVACIQEAQRIIEKNPTDAYAHYYQALAYQQIGKAEDAKAAFEKVATLNVNRTLTEYAQKGIACTTSEEACLNYENNKPELDMFVKSTKQIHNTVQKEINEKKLNRIKENINNELSKKKVNNQQTMR